MKIWHVYPTDDLREHIIDGWEDGRRCWCRPESDEDGGLIVHKALDQREKYETGQMHKH